ncbi:MAG: hypothetical protein WC067_03290 [Candidatus Methanomethylophilaceae archaeon]
MDTDKAFENIQNNIKDEKYELVRPEVDAIVSANGGNASVLLKCASLLKVVDDEQGCQAIIDLILDKIPNDPDKKFEIGIAIRNLGRAEDAYGLMKIYSDDATRRSEIARTLLNMDEAEEALELMNTINDKNVDERILLSEILCSLGEFKMAYETAATLAEDDRGSYDSLVNLCTVLMHMGKEKEALKIAKSHIKEDKKNADSLALGAYVMRIDGKISAAANFANRALQIDHTHVGALETMAYCLIEKHRFIQAKFFAGAINDKEPGNPAVIRILDACRIMSKT